MAVHPDNPLIVQGDRTVLVELASPRYRQARDRLLRFAELVKSPEHVHTYRITPLSVWNARAAGVGIEAILGTLEEYARYPVPKHLLQEIHESADRYGRLELRRLGGTLVLSADGPALCAELGQMHALRDFLGDPLPPRSFRVNGAQRGHLKLALIKEGWPVRDLAGFVDGDPLALQIRARSSAGQPFALRDYQSAAADSFHAAGTDRGGNGVVVLPCGAGKTLVGIAAMARLETWTLILTTSTTAVRQWMRELLDKSTLSAGEVGEYTGARKEIRPVTVSTYQILTNRGSQRESFPHFQLFDRREWGLIIYDEVHLLPAPVFQITADLQARRRLGLTATLVREDGLEDDVFALIGPKCHDVPWKELEREGWIAKALCREVRISLPPDERSTYANLGERYKHRFAAENPDKDPLVDRLLAAHEGEPALIIGTYVDQVRALAERLGIPMLSGSSSNKLREELYEAFRNGELRALAVTKIANFAVDLPDASLAIQISGTFGSRQEEAQRLGRLLRPKPGANQAHFYTLVTRDTKEQQFALNRQLFLCEQGYEYEIVDGAELLSTMQ